MTEKKQWFCEICTRTFDGDHAYAHVEIFLNSINKRDTGYIDQYYSDIARLGMCYNCLQEGLMIWKLHKLQERVLDLQSGKLINEITEKE